MYDAFPFSLGVSVETVAASLMGVPLYVICHFPLVAFNILSSPFIFISLITMWLSVFLLGFILPGTLCFPDLLDYFLSHVWEVFSYYPFKYFFRSFLSLSSASETPIMQMLLHLMLSQRSLRLSSFLFILFFYILFCGSDFHHSVLRVIYPCFCLSYSAVDSF